MKKLLALLSILVISASLDARGGGGGHAGGAREGGGEHYNEAYRGGGERTNEAYRGGGERNNEAYRGYGEAQLNRDARQLDRNAGNYGASGVAVEDPYWEGDEVPVNPNPDEQEGEDIYQNDKIE